MTDYHDPETWVEISEFPGYAVSNHGRIMNTRTELIKRPTKNQQGIPNVLLMLDGAQHRRSVALLVASNFLPPPTRVAFDTPINLDGNRENNQVSNLEWRPRWFALKYHAQFKDPVSFGFDHEIELIQTGEIFENVRDAAKQYGLLEKEVVLSTHNRSRVFPTWHEFKLA